MRTTTRACQRLTSTSWPTRMRAQRRAQSRRATWSNGTQQLVSMIITVDAGPDRRPAAAGGGGAGFVQAAPARNRDSKLFRRRQQVKSSFQSVAKIRSRNGDTPELPRRTHPVLVVLTPIPLPHPCPSSTTPRPRAAPPRSLLPSPPASRLTASRCVESKYTPLNTDWTCDCSLRLFHSETIPLCLFCSFQTF